MMTNEENEFSASAYWARQKRTSNQIWWEGFWAGAGATCLMIAATVLIMLARKFGA